MAQPVLTIKEHDALVAARDSGVPQVEVSLDLDRSRTVVQLTEGGWSVDGETFPFLERCKDNTVYYWSGTEFLVASRFASSLIKLVPTEWGAPTFQIDGIKMLPTKQVSPYEDAKRKVGLVQPRGKVILDTCGGLGYFAAWCLAEDAKKIQSYEINPDVVWLRELNPWSPKVGGALTLTLGDIGKVIASLGEASFDAILHDPPRFGIAGDLYSQVFYDQLRRVLKPGGILFHYTGSPNKLTSGRDVPKEVTKRLQKAGFTVEVNGDGLLAVKGKFKR